MGRSTLGQEALDHLKALPFVTRVDHRLTLTRELRDGGYDSELTIWTPSSSFDLLVVENSSSLSRFSVNALMDLADRLAREHRKQIILFARYIPRTVGEELMIKHKVNFVDRVGNIHLELGPSYNWTALGNPEEKPPVETPAVSLVQVKLLFEFATNPESLKQTVRQLESATGISKSNVAQVRKQLIAQELIIHKRPKKYTLNRTSMISERLVSGYSQILRPRLFLGRFRFPENTAEPFLTRLEVEALSASFRYALTGGAAADVLQHFYRGAETPVFITSLSRSTLQNLRLLPDEEGPVIFLRAFGDTVFSKEHLRIARPWFIYCELLNSADPRAHEAAEEFRRHFLS